MADEDTTRCKHAVLYILYTVVLWLGIFVASWGMYNVVQDCEVDTDECKSTGAEYLKALAKDHPFMTVVLVLSAVSFLGTFALFFVKVAWNCMAGAIRYTLYAGTITALLFSILFTVAAIMTHHPAKFKVNGANCTYTCPSHSDAQSGYAEIYAGIILLVVLGLAPAARVLYLHLRQRDGP
jgi:uncharacterized protein (DUF983 family)